MDILILILLILAGVILLMVELFVAPGISIAGIAAFASLLYAIYYAFTELGSLAGFITLTITVVGTLLFIWGFMRSKMLDKLSLHKNIDSKVCNEAIKEIKEGDRGVAVTRIALLGNADFNGNVVEVKSLDGFLDEKTPLIIDRIENGVVLVKENKE